MIPTAMASRSTNMSDDRPVVAVGHVRLHTGDVAESAAFYEAIGLRPVMAWDGMAILELRGGTHLLLIEVDDEMQMTLDPVFDLMVDDLDTYQEMLLAAGITPSGTSWHAKIGHQRFRIEDPDGHRVYVYSDHTEGRPV